MVRTQKILDNAKKIIKQHYLVLLIIIFLSVSHYMIVKDYKALPSPLYGGDYYFQLGATNHVKYGGNPIDSSNINDSLPAYFVTYSFLSGNIAKIFNISALSAEIVLSYITIIASALLIYLLTYRLFKNNYVAAISAFIYNIPVALIFKYTTFAHQIVMILLILVLYAFLEKESYKNAIILGIILGISGLTHSVLFMSSILLLGFVFTYMLITRNKHQFINRQYKKIFYNIIKYALVIVIGVAIALLWWFKPIFYYHGETASHYTDIEQEQFNTFSQQFSAAKYVFSMTILNFTSPVGIIFSLFSIAGLIFIFITKDIEEKKFIKLIFFSAIIINLHFLITYNLFGFHLIPSYMTYLLVYPVSILLFAFGLHIASNLIKNKTYVYILFALLMLILIILLIITTIKTDKDQWSNNAKTELSPHLIDVEKYLVKNTDVYDTILSSNEVSFAINAISGRKVMISRRAQNDPFMDMDRRQVDAAIILYGNDTTKKMELLKKYDIKYLYWDQYWINSEFYINDKGAVVGWFDPLLTLTEYNYHLDFDRYGIKYFQDNTWVDPTLKGENMKKFDVAIISPENYHNFTHPWNPNLDQYLEEVWSYNQSGQQIAILYRVKI